MEAENKRIADLAQLRESPGLRRVYQEPVLGIGGWIAAAAITLALALLIRAFVFQSYKIPSESMLPTLRVGDHILVNKFIYGFYLPWSKEPILALRKPARGDVVVFYPGSDEETKAEGRHNGPEHLIKRIVAVPGDMVQVINFYAYVNGKRVDDSARLIALNDAETIEEHHGIYGPIKLEANQYFVLGDNRINSSDSRYFGPIERRQIEGRAFLIYWSWAQGVVWERIGLGIR